MYTNKTILITGGTGSWGQELTKRLLEFSPKQIRIFSRSELPQVHMSRTFNDSTIKYIIGDIRDESALDQAMKNVDYVFHLAALKHVPICEEYPEEAIKTNILGTRNVIHTAIHNQVQKVIHVSTDKAVAPFNLYGISKSASERLIIQANLLESNTRFTCIRAGNVLGSNGSVIPLFIEQIRTQNKITLTHPDMTRYFLTIQEAIDLLFKASINTFGGETLVMKMPVFRIQDLAEVLIKHYGNESTQIEIIGVRAGEKLHEELLYTYEYAHTYEYNEHYFLVLPTLNIPGLLSHYHETLKQSPLTNEPFTEQLLDKDAIETVLRNAHFI
ncbi:MAG: polysaccharide biosynthesis protein [Cellulosilyticaceae bacterium]